MSAIRLLVCTWNVGNKAPTETLDPLIPRNGEGYDMIVVGCQEATYSKEFSHPSDVHDEEEDEKDDLSKASSPITASPTKEEVVTSGKVNKKKQQAKAVKEEKPKSPTRKEPFKFFDRVSATVGDGFQSVHHKNLLQMGLIVFATTALNKRITNVECSEEATGIMGVVGNKGGIVIKVHIDEDTTLAFCSCHLAAHSGEKHRHTRNSNIQEILLGARVGIKELDFLSQFTHVFWMGDMNYRIDLNYLESRSRDPKHHEKHEIKELSHEDEWNQVKALIDANDIKKLKEADELSFEISKQNTLSGFTEGPINFLPTFKVERKVGLFHKKQRTPSYCDRILWKSMPAFASDVVQIKYDSCCDLGTSDHKPVFASFNVNTHSKIPINHAIRDGPIIKFQDMKCTDILAADMNGLSDPYITFRAYPTNLLTMDVSDPPTSSTIMATLNPVFPDDKMPTLFPGLNKKEDLQKCHLILAVMDYDKTSDDDLLGTVCFPFSELMDATSTGASYEFNKDIISHGKAYGRISGIIRILWPKDADYKINNARGTTNKNKREKCIIC